MSQYYLCPITSQQQTIGGQTLTISAPKYLQSDLAGLTFTCVPFGGEGWGIVTLAAANSALNAESDVYRFPADLTTVMQDADVSTLAAYLATANCPSDSIVAGMSFNDALQIIAKIFLVAQAINGPAVILATQRV
jgi:hypothetical protein